MSTKTPSRPKNTSELRERLGMFKSDESTRAGQEFRPRSDDVFIATYPKCGTTWVQQIVHALRSEGDMAFDEITEVVPWLELAHDLGVNPHLEQRANPRAFKTHFSWHDVPKGARYIHVTREPVDTLKSFYRFFEGWFFEEGSIDIDTFARDIFLGGTGSGAYWQHVNAWWPVRDRPDVLFLCFEDMRAQPRQAIARIATFIGCRRDEHLLDLAEQQSSLATMRKYPTKYDDHLVRKVTDKACRLPPSGKSMKVSEKSPNREGLTLSDDVLEALKQRWREDVESTLGLRTYDELRRMLADESPAK